MYLSEKEDETEAQCTGILGTCLWSRAILDFLWSWAFGKLCAFEKANSAKLVMQVSEKEGERNRELRSMLVKTGNPLGLYFSGPKQVQNQDFKDMLAKSGYPWFCLVLSQRMSHLKLNTNILITRWGLIILWISPFHHHERSIIICDPIVIVSELLFCDQGYEAQQSYMVSITTHLYRKTPPLIMPYDKVYQKSTVKHLISWQGFFF